MRRLRLTRAHGRTVAPLRGRTIELGDDDFVVVTGPNESGKSTLAEVLSWVLAGRRNDHEAGLRLAAFPSPDTNMVEVEAAIEGLVDGSPFEVGRLFKIRRRQQGRQPAESAPVITVDGATMTPTSWGNTIGVATGDDYFRTYRITGPYDADQLVDIGELLEALAIGVAATTSPRAVLDTLKTQADLLVPPPDGRLNDQRALKAPTDALAAAKARRQQAILDERSIDTLQAEIDALDDDRGRLDAERGQLVLDKSAHETARGLLSARADLDAAQRELRELPSVPTSWADALGRPGELDVALARLGEAEAAAGSAAADLEQARVRADLSREDLARLTIEQSDVDALGGLDTRRAAAQQRIDSDRNERPPHEREREAALQRLAQRAEQLGCTTEQLLTFARMTADDVAFGDPVKAWPDAEESLAECDGKLGEVRQRRERAASARADLERRWIDTGETRAPEVVALGEAAAQTPGGVGRAVGNLAWWQFALMALVIAGASAVKWWLGIVVAVVLGAVLLLVRRPQSTATGGAAPLHDVVALASGLLAAREADARADDELRTAIEAHRRAGEDRDRRRERALVVLADFGLPHVDTATRAARLRAERSTIVREEVDLAGLDRLIADLGAAAAEARDELVEIDRAVTAISERIGVSQFGPHLDATTGQRLLDAVRAREVHESKAEELARRQDELSELLPDLPAGIAAEAAGAEVHTMSGLLRMRNDLDERIGRARQSLEAADERALALLDDPDVSASLLDLRIDELGDRIAELRERVDGLLQSRGSLVHQFEEITSRCDLAAINQEIEQAAAEQREIATEGAAWWVARRLVADVKDEVEANQQPELVRRASELAQRITAGHWQSISTDDEGNLVVRQGADSIAQKSLSAGARDVLRLVIRLAVAEAHSARKGVALPIILDDPTASVDSTRAPRLFEVLAEFATRHQVILMTHDEQTIAQAVAVGAVEVPIDAS